MVAHKMHRTATILAVMLGMVVTETSAKIPACGMSPSCKTHQNCEAWGGPHTENHALFNTTCLNNVRWAEPRNSGKYDQFWDAGVYKCSCCGQELYSSAHKYSSGSGWPAFYETVNVAAVLVNPTDGELVCSRCGAHLGHRFSDGPHATTGIRDCINSVCLDFKADGAYPASDPYLKLAGSYTGNSLVHDTNAEQMGSITASSTVQSSTEPDKDPKLSGAEESSKISNSETQGSGGSMLMTSCVLASVISGIHCAILALHL